MKLTQTSMAAIMTALTASSGPFDPATTYLALAEAVTDHGRLTVIGDVTVPDGTAYPRKAITTWGTAYNLADGRLVRDAAIKVWVPPDALNPTLVSYYALFSALTAGNLLAYGPVSPPVGLVDTSTAVSIIVRLTVDPSGRWSTEVVFDG